MEKKIIESDLNRLRKAKNLFIIISFIGIVIVAILLLSGVINIIKDIDSQTKMLEIGFWMITGLILLSAGVSFLFGKSLKTDIYDLYCISSIVQLDHTINELSRLRNDIAVNRDEKSRIEVNVKDLK